MEANENPDALFTTYHTNHFYKPWYGEEKREDHYMQPNALDYLHLPLEGPIPSPNRRAPESAERYGDVFVIPDQGSFYLAVNIRGLGAEIPFDRKPDGSQDLLQVAGKLEVRLLSLSSKSGAPWQTVGEIVLDPVRNGFWHGQLEGKELPAYSMIGVFDTQNPSPFTHPQDANEKLRGAPLPVLWKWLVSTDATTQRVGTAVAAESSVQ